MEGEYPGGVSTWWWVCPGGFEYSGVEYLGWVCPGRVLRSEHPGVGMFRMSIPGVGTQRW